MGAVYQKLLKLSGTGKQCHSTGEIVNYVAVDAYRLGEFPLWFHTALDSPTSTSYGQISALGNCWVRSSPWPGASPHMCPPELPHLPRPCKSVELFS